MTNKSGQNIFMFTPCNNSFKALFLFYWNFKCLQHSYDFIIVCISWNNKKVLWPKHVGDPTANRKEYCATSWVWFFVKRRG